MGSTKAINYVICACLKEPKPDGSYTVVCMTGCENQPTEADKKDLLRELREDPEFGFRDEELILIDAAPDVVEDFKRMLEDKIELN